MESAKHQFRDFLKVSSLKQSTCRALAPRSGALRMLSCWNRSRAGAGGMSSILW